MQRAFWTYALMANEAFLLIIPGLSVLAGTCFQYLLYRSNKTRVTLVYLQHLKHSEWRICFCGDSFLKKRTPSFTVKWMVKRVLACVSYPLIYLWYEVSRAEKKCVTIFWYIHWPGHSCWFHSSPEFVLWCLKMSATGHSSSVSSKVFVQHIPQKLD